ncbi:MAG TPA: prepilin-type N-terminal cleavage/methylation domain-containing protein [Stellaceae bacterium]|nr:prepilin-type N-terminal cleavage/methylation domain-containing protein [Stellaceae bacterium]
MSRGFTLLELLTALAVLAMIALMLLGSTHYGIAVWRRTDALAATAGELALSRAILAHDLGNAFPEWHVEPPGVSRIAFDGGPDRATFLAPAPASMGGAGLVRYTLAAAGAEGAARLELSAIRELGTSDPPPASVLVDRAARIELAYWGPGSTGEAPAWQDTWRERAELPSLIRVRVAFVPDDNRRWPDLVVAPRIAVDGTCGYDPMSFHCRGR